VWKLLKNAKLYNPELMNDTDIIIVGRSIAALGRDFRLPDHVEGEVIDLHGKRLVYRCSCPYLRRRRRSRSSFSYSGNSAFPINSGWNDDGRWLFGDGFCIPIYG